ncbi:ExbD/TolR family protein [Shimia sagamensis]|uniref:Biopolymer transport protein ExbD n=1 Tax=Shimia sagamensis TaxID=1566352 RepID=A0ABY1PHS7_9RHOB|nr:biopolymer transporter ExbD [Shimia sagamensis]SMP34746.1 biopolymer transport protein ExbD [Shimia sagamensis]
MTLSRPQTARGRISLVPLIDVLFILLVYFMVTSVYLDLDMIPVARKTDFPATSPQAGVTNEGRRVLLRITSDGNMNLRGLRLDDANQASALSALASEVPPPQVLILPSGAAPLFALTNALDALALAGLTDTRVVRIESRP